MAEPIGLALQHRRSGFAHALRVDGGRGRTFRADDEPQKHHTIHLRQTPFYQKGYEPAGKREAFLYQVGNKDVVRCLAECNEVLTLIYRDNPYAELYADLVKRCEAIVDAYPWLTHEEGFGLAETLRDIDVPEAQLRMRASQLWHWLYFRGVTDFAGMKNVSKIV